MQPLRGGASAPPGNTRAGSQPAPRPRLTARPEGADGRRPARRAGIRGLQCRGSCTRRGAQRGPRGAAARGKKSQPGRIERFSMRRIAWPRPGIKEAACQVVWARRGVAVARQRGRTAALPRRPSSAVRYGWRAARGAAALGSNTPGSRAGPPRGQGDGPRAPRRAPRALLRAARPQSTRPAGQHPVLPVGRAGGGVLGLIWRHRRDRASVLPRPNKTDLELRLWSAGSRVHVMVSRDGRGLQKRTVQVGRRGRQRSVSMRSRARARRLGSCAPRAPSSCVCAPAVRRAGHDR